MKDVLLTVEQGWNAQLFFLNLLWESSKDRFIENRKRVRDFISFHSFTFSPGFHSDYYDDWQNIWCDFCQMNSGQLFSKSSRLSTKKVIQLMIHYIVNYDARHRPGQCLKELINVYKLIESSPDTCRKDYELWCQAAQRVMAGEHFVEESSLSR